MEPQPWLSTNESFGSNASVHKGLYPYYDEDYDYEYAYGNYSDRPPPPLGPPSGPHFNYNQPKTIHFVCVGIIIPIGFFFNTLACVVFMTSRTLRKTTTGHYLLALSIADLLFLVGEFLRWLSTPNMAHLGWHVDFLDHVDALCKLVMALRYGTKLASAWLTVVITVERFITVAFPLKIVTISTPKNAKVTICLIYMASLAGGCFPMWTVGVQVFGDLPMCIIYPDKHPMYNIFSWIFLRAGSLIVPGILISVFCILIGIHLNKAKTVRKRKLSTNSTASTGSSISPRSLERQLTMMLLAVALSFVFLRLPYTIVYYLHSYKTHIYGSPIDPEISYKLFYALKMTDIFVAINYASNFFLYCWCGSSFRRQLKVLFCKKKRRRFSRDTGSSVMSLRTGSTKSDCGKQVELKANGMTGARSLIKTTSGRTPPGLAETKSAHRADI